MMEEKLPFLPHGEFATSIIDVSSELGKPTLIFVQIVAFKNLAFL